MKAQQKLLITGVSGMLGNNLAQFFKGQYEILGLYNRNRVDIGNISTLRCDLGEKGAARLVIQSFKPDIILHCAGLADVDQCEHEPGLAETTNVLATRYLVEEIQDPETKLVYISSDAVYRGDKGNFTEQDEIAPQNQYGATKYRGELESLEFGNTLVLRTNIFGWNMTAKRGLAEWILHNLLAGQQISGFADVIFSTIYTGELARIIDNAIRGHLTGIYNCGNRDSCSKYQFAVKLADQFDLDNSLVTKSSLNDCEFIANRGKNLSMDSGRIQKNLGLTVPSIDESIYRCHAEYKK